MYVFIFLERPTHAVPLAGLFILQTFSCHIVLNVQHYMFSYNHYSIISTAVVNGQCRGLKEKFIVEVIEVCSSCKRKFFTFKMNSDLSHFL